MKLWIVDTFAGTQHVVYAADAEAATAGVRDSDRTLVRGVREWPAEATFSVAFVPTSVLTDDATTEIFHWNGQADWGTVKGLGDILEAVTQREGFAQTLNDEHERGHHEKAPVQ